MEKALTQYPEFAGVILLSFVLALNAAKEGNWPAFLAQPASACLELFPERYSTGLKSMLIRANLRRPSAFADLACSKIYLPLLALLALTVLPPHMVLPAAAIIFFLPDLFVYTSMVNRQKEIRDSLPQAIDLLVLCVDAGLGLDAALQKVSAEEKGLPRAINEELSTLGREIFLGIDRERAYTDLFTRTGVDELKTFGSALNQASRLGLSIAKILRAQSEFIRKRQSQKIEEKAMKMPVYMAFPLWFCIMPALLLLVLGPSLIKFYQQLHTSF